VIIDGELRKYHNFWTYSVHGLDEYSPRWLQDTFCGRPYSSHAAAHQRALSLQAARGQLSGGCPALRPGSCQAGRHLAVCAEPQYPAHGIPGYTREEFLEDVLREHETEIRRCLQKGAHTVQVDFTEGRLSMKVDPSWNLLNSFIDLNNLALSRFSADERQAIGVHTCPGGDRDSTHARMSITRSCCRALFELKAGNFYIALAAEII
jgi:5-methyltetrahydropteroyltriglutamate--homocysteine methyltransferase